MSPILESLAGVAVDKAIEFGATSALSTNWRFVAGKLYRRHDTLRVSFAALLRLQLEDRYVLVRNLHQEDRAAPFGGVYKYHPEAHEALTRAEYRQQLSHPEMSADLRGYLPLRNGGEVDKWFRQLASRETHVECLKREIIEELGEVRAKSKLPTNFEPRFAYLWTVREGPYKVRGDGYSYQFRHLDIYEFPASYTQGALLTRTLAELSSSKKGIVLASSREIELRRTDSGVPIAHTAEYLLRKSRVRPDDRPHTHFLQRNASPHRTPNER